MKLVWQFAVQIKRLLIFVLSLVGIYLAYVYLLPEVWQRSNVLLALMSLWFFTAYVVLPYAHRLLSTFYVPDHFIGRFRTADGLLSDPVNLALNGDVHQLKAAMKTAGWEQTDELNFKNSVKAVKANVLKKSYPRAPASDGFLFGKKQNYTFQKQVDNNPRQRHHIRFWRTPRNWHLPGGKKVDWIGGATYDEAVAISFFTGQFTHRIGKKVDKERDFVMYTLKTSRAAKNVQKIEHFFPGYRARNGFGHHYETDGSMVIADLSDTPS